MAKQLFSNNASATLSAAITDSATSISVVTGKGALFNAPTGGDYELLTITDGTNYEIVKCTARSSDTLTVTRAQESTTARAWSAGATMAGYVTRGTLENMRTQGSGTNAIAIGDGAAATATGAIAIGLSSVAGSGGCVVGRYANNPDIGATLLDWAATTAYAVNVAILIGSLRCKCLRAGTSGGTVPSISVSWGETFLDGSIIWRLEPVSGVVDSTAMGNYSVGVEDGVAVGHSAKAYHATAVGSAAFASEFSAAFGQNARANAGESIALGNSCKTYDINNSLAVSGLPSMQHPANWNFGAEYQDYVGITGQIASEYIDLTGGAAWSASTSITHGHTRRPTTPNGCQYSRYDNAFSASSDPGTLSYTASTTDTTEPTWPTTFGDSVTDGDGDWICIPHDGSYEMGLAAPMVIEEVFFVCYEAVGITAQANISLGTFGNLTKIVNNQPTVGLTANNTVTRWTLSQPVMVSDITIKIETLATGSKMLGKFMFRGFYAKFK